MNVPEDGKKELRLALLGSPVSHSRSPQLHRALAASCGFDLRYEVIDTTGNRLEETVRYLKKERFDGFNCTMPLKTAMASLADTLDDESRRLRSANTVKITPDGRLEAFTTDGEGLCAALARRGSDPKGKIVTMLGAGGTARSAAGALLAHGAKELRVVNRSPVTPETLLGIREKTNGIDPEIVTVLPLSEENLRKACRGAGIFFNATPLGMKGHGEFSDLSFLGELAPGAVVTDAVYEPEDTVLVKTARKTGLTAENGLPMLAWQGILAFTIWTGIIPGENAVSAALEAVGTNETKNFIIQQRNEV